MVSTADSDDAGTPAPHDAEQGEDLSAAAVRLAHRWIDEGGSAPIDAAAERLAAVMRDRRGLPFTLGFVDGVLRPESLVAAASGLHRVAPLVPDLLPWHLRQAVRVGGSVAPALPAPVVLVARRMLRELVGHLIIDARPNKLGPALEKLRADGARLNLNLLGEAVLGEDEAAKRLEGIRELVRRDDVDHVSVKVSAIASRLSPWAFDEMVDEVADTLLPLYLEAATSDTFINLDMEEYRDLDLTIAVFTRLLEDPRLRRAEAGIVLQAYLPDSLAALREVSAWARQRVDAGGAPVKVRLVKGANLPMERVDAAMHGWASAPYETKVDTDANYLRMLDEALRPERTRAVRIGVAGHNLYDIAHAWLLASERGVRDAMDVEMLLGMAPAQVAAVSRDVGSVLLYVPVVRPDEFDAAVGYLARRLEENAAAENFLSAAFELHHDERLRDRERERYVASVERAASPALGAHPRRRQDRAGGERAVATALTAESAGSDADRAGGADVDGVDRDGADVDDATIPIRRPAPPAEEGLTQVVLGIGRGATDDGATAPLALDAQQLFFGGAALVETAVYAPRQRSTAAAGAPGFVNVPDSDPAVGATRAWARRVLEQVPGSALGRDLVERARVDDAPALDAVLTRVRAAGRSWARRGADERATVLERAAAVLAGRRGALIEVAASETGKVFAEADAEVSEAIDSAAYYAATARELDAVSGAVFVPDRLTVVASPWNFPLAIPAGGVLAALAAGSGVVLTPAPQARRCAALIVEALWDAGVPRDALALADIDEDELGHALITHPRVDRVILTGAWETAAMFRSWRPDLELSAETSGKNAMVITPSADLDLAAADLVRSAFGHAGQKCSAASLAILVGPVARSRRFARQLVDATTSLRVGLPEDPRSEVGPLIEPPTGKLEWALTTLDEGERWLVRPRPLDDERRLWSPGIRTGVEAGSRFHREEFFGPVLGVMHARNLDHAIELQNAVDYGLTAGLYTQQPSDLARWLARVEAGNLYVNRGMTGAVVQRQPFGGWKRSSVGTGAKPGGPNHLVGLGAWRAASGTPSSSLHLRGLDSRLTTVIEAAQQTLDYEGFDWVRRAALSDAVAWDREFGQVRDVTGLGVERNLFRYRPVPVAVRASGDAPWPAVLRVVLAGVRSRSSFSLSTPVGLPAPVRRALAELDVPVQVESEAEWLERMSRPGGASSARADEPRPPRVRLVGGGESVRALRRALADAVNGDPDLTIHAGEVTTAGRIELLTFLREQSISITAHRFGTSDPWSTEVI
ncbi:bifunctional proline dehydrogenase/L-glutamate gamma-semialdehyde dehydrogenase [Microbacterium sp. LRZ72]|uniref:bifunctional proline dehydrogenase/L-glutamate gamma-semialdehyde dehydrogenase n=1 Tax=Microbacterium sp. LRZ72 TaxID=2942481 RepID=UPI0029BB3C25|nr:bifunctional proline dehydrogenase/L-glutamate gamma-semialdehyde dehydrogenase [Microbacterium sp. LRZ72]MDX2376456.1 bifunctional proline dehydrogenase/L-glutamate gamma-semialdehyde dehydrogenase [Microbacterium sp. LRZ72]